MAAKCCEYAEQSYRKLVERVLNGTGGKSPQPGDVISYGATSSFGHVAIVSEEYVDDSGNGTIVILEQNAAATGHRSLKVENWYVRSGSTPVAWLHAKEDFPQVKLASHDSMGFSADGSSFLSKVSDDGRYVTFAF